MKTSVPYWIRKANYAHRIITEADNYAKIRIRSRERLAKKQDALVGGFTDKAWKIINGEWTGSLRTNEVTKLIQKAEDYGRFDIADKLREMYEYLYEGPDHIDRLPKEEALDILEDLRPESMKEKK